MMNINDMETHNRMMLGSIISVLGMYAGMFLFTMLPEMGIFVIAVSVHAGLGVSFNQPKLYAVMTGLALVLCFGPLWGVGLLPYLAASAGWQLLFLGNPIYQFTTFLEKTTITEKFVSKTQARIARICLTLGLGGIAYGLCMPITAMIGWGALGIAVLGGNLYAMPISPINKALLFKRVSIIATGTALGIVGVVIAVSSPVWLPIGWLMLLAGTLGGVWLRNREKEQQLKALRGVGATLAPHHTFEDVERLYKALPQLRAEHDAREAARWNAYLMALNPERENGRMVLRALANTGTLEDIQAFLEDSKSRSEKEVVFLEVMKNTKQDRDLIVTQVLESQKNSDFHIRALKQKETPKQNLEKILNKNIWVNGNITGIFNNLEAQGIDVQAIYKKIGFDKKGNYLPYVRPVADKMRESMVRAMINSGAPRNAEDLEAQKRAKAVIEKNNKKPELVALFNTKRANGAGSEKEIIEVIHQEIRGRLLDEIFNTLKDECDPAQADKVKVKTPHAQEIIACIQERRSGLIHCNEQDLEALHPLILENNEVSAMVAWRMYDPKAPTGSYASFLLPSTVDANVYVTREVVDGAVTEQKASEIIRKDAAFCYLSAVRDDLKNKDDAAWQRFVGMISSAGRGNNIDDNGVGADHRTCFPGFRTRLGEFLGGDCEGALRGIIGQRIESTFERSMRNPELSKQQKTELYDAVMLLENNDAKTLLEGGYFLRSDPEMRPINKDDPRIAQFMKVRKQFIEQAFGVTITETLKSFIGADLVAIISKKMVALLGQQEIHVTQDKVMNYLEYYLLRMECNKNNISNLYSRHVANVGVVSVVANPFGATRVVWESYKTTQQYDQYKEVPIRQKRLESQFVSSYLSHTLFELLIKAGVLPENAENSTRELVEFLKAENQSDWKQDKVNDLESKLLAPTFLDSYLSYVLYDPALQAVLQENTMSDAETESLRVQKKAEADGRVAVFKAKQPAAVWKLENMKTLEAALLDPKPEVSPPSSPVIFGSGSSSGTVVQPGVTSTRAQSPVSRV